MPSILYSRPHFDSQDTSELKALYDAYAPALHGVIRRFTVENATGHTILQRSFIVMHREIISADTTAASRFSWMLRITLHQIKLMMKISAADIAAKYKIDIH